MGELEKGLRDTGRNSPAGQEGGDASIEATRKTSIEEGNEILLRMIRSNNRDLFPRSTDNKYSEKVQAQQRADFAQFKIDEKTGKITGTIRDVPVVATHTGEDYTVLVGGKQQEYPEELYRRLSRAAHQYNEVSEQAKEDTMNAVDQEGRRIDQMVPEIQDTGRKLTGLIEEQREQLEDWQKKPE